MQNPPTLSLNDLPAGGHALVKSVRVTGPRADASLVRRLTEIGFVAGEPLRLLRRGPGGREPLAVQIGDTMFALRAVEARCVEVEHVDV